MADISGALTTVPGGTVIAVDVSAGSKSDLFPSAYNPWRKTLGCIVSAPPVSGKANLAITRLIASVLGISTQDVSIITGALSNHKKVLVRKMDTRKIQKILEDLIPG